MKANATIDTDVMSALAAKGLFRVGGFVRDQFQRRTRRTNNRTNILNFNTSMRFEVNW